VVWCLSGRVENYLTARDVRKYNTDLVALKVQAETSAKLAATNEQSTNDYKIIVAQVLTENRRLNDQIAARDLATKKQQETDKTLPPVELAYRWQSLAELPLNSVTPTPGAFSITDGAARQTVVLLETVPQLKADLADTQAEKKNVEDILEHADSTLMVRADLIASLESQLGKADKVCEDRIKIVKDDARKSKRHWFIAGYVAGLATRAAIKIATGF
jgi:hypothetical protein